jgi:hypothetical protein
MFCCPVRPPCALPRIHPTDISSSVSPRIHLCQSSNGSQGVRYAMAIISWDIAPNPPTEQGTAMLTRLPALPTLLAVHMCLQRFHSELVSRAQKGQPDVPHPHQGVLRGGGEADC